MGLYKCSRRGLAADSWTLGASLPLALRAPVPPPGPGPPENPIRQLVAPILEMRRPNKIGRSGLQQLPPRPPSHQRLARLDATGSTTPWTRGTSTSPTVHPHSVHAVRKSKTAFCPAHEVNSNGRVRKETHAVAAHVPRGPQTVPARQDRVSCSRSPARELRDTERLAESGQTRSLHFKYQVSTHFQALAFSARPRSSGGFC